MIRTFVDRWKKTWRASPADAGPTVLPDRRVAARAQGPAGEPDNAVSALSLGARLPLVDRQGQLVGFEFRLADEALQRLRRQEDKAAAIQHGAALFDAMRLTVDTGRLAYTELPPGWIEHPTQPGQLTPGMLIAIPLIEALGEFTPEGLSNVMTMRAAGAKVGWAGDFPRAFAPDFLQLPVSAIRTDPQAELGDFHPGLADIESRVQSASRRRLPVLATGIAHIEDLETALRAGVAQAVCAIPSHGEPRHPQAVSPRVQRMCQLLNRLLRDEDTAAIVADIKADVGLSYRLLHYLNMAGIGMAQQIESIEQAVTLLGRNELYRWLAALMIRQAATRPAAGVLQEIALARGRLLELLAIDRGEPEPGSLFILGLVSMLGLLLDTTLDDAIAPLHLPAKARKALLLHEGEWLEYLAMSWHLDDPNPLVAKAMAEHFGGLDHVLARATQSWQWAAAVHRGGR